MDNKNSSKTILEKLENLLNIFFKSSLLKKWISFINVILDPWVVILTLATIYFIYYSNSPQTTDKNIISILTLIISLFSAIIGGILANRWAEMTELKVLVARGKTAIRSLKLILLNISKIEKRTKDYISGINNENEDFKVVISNFEEIIEKCNILGEEIISSIENWTDIIPEVENMKTQIGVISDMKNREKQLEADVLNLNNNLATEKEIGELQKVEMQRKITDKEKELSKVKDKLDKAENKINSTVLSGLTFSSPLSNTNSYSSLLGLTSDGKYQTIGSALSSLSSDSSNILQQYSDSLGGYGTLNTKPKNEEKKIIIKGTK